MTKNETMRLALDALSYAADEIWCENDDDIIADAVRALRTALAQPKKEWVGLTGEEILEEYRQSYGDDGDLTDVYFARAIESKLKEKNI